MNKERLNALGKLERAVGKIIESHNEIGDKVITQIIDYGKGSNPLELYSVLMSRTNHDNLVDIYKECKRLRGVKPDTVKIGTSFIFVDKNETGTTVITDDGIKYIDKDYNVKDFDKDDLIIVRSHYLDFQ